MDEARRCTAKSKRSGERCKRAAAIGATVCAIHGGKAPQVKAKAKEREVERKAVAAAQRMVALAGTDQHPLDHLLEALHHAAALEQVWGTMVSELDEVAEAENADNKTRGELHYTEDAAADSPYELVVRSKDRLLALDRHGQAGVHPYVQKLEEAIDRRAKLAKMCLDAGVAERQVKIVEVQVQLTQKALERTFDKLGLPPEQKQEARRVFAGYLRSGS